MLRLVAVTQTPGQLPNHGGQFRKQRLLWWQVTQSIIRAGTYAEVVTPYNSGLPGQYIVYAAYPGEAVTIDGSSVSLPPGASGLFNVWKRAISEFRACVSSMQVLLPEVVVWESSCLKSSYIVIENNYTYNTHSSGIGVWQSDNISVDGNEVELACNDGSQEEITISQTHGFVVKNNYVHNGGPGTNGGEGIDAKDGILRWSDLRKSCGRCA